jgi:hypothetical protein
VSDTIYCRAGVRIGPFECRTLWVRSPRTGREIRVGDGWLTDIPNGQRLWTRVVQAMSQNRPAAFTPDELKALVALEAKIAAKSRPLPPGPDRRGWGRR